MKISKVRGITFIDLYEGPFGGVVLTGRGWFDWSLDVYAYSATIRRQKGFWSLDGLKTLYRVVYFNNQSEEWQEKLRAQWQAEAEAFRRMRREIEERWARKEREKQKQQHKHRKPIKKKPPKDAYGLSLELLGLADGFMEADLTRAFRKAMQKAHPDAGGSHDEALAVNYARDLIKERMGWS